jgi:hypothetical protein
LNREVFISTCALTGRPLADAGRSAERGLLNVELGLCGPTPPGLTDWMLRQKAAGIPLPGPQLFSGPGKTVRAQPASDDPEVIGQSLELCYRAIDLSAAWARVLFGPRRVRVHASPSDLGGDLTALPASEDVARRVFVDSLRRLCDYAGRRLDILWKTTCGAGQPRPRRTAPAAGGHRG